MKDIRKADWKTYTLTISLLSGLESIWVATSYAARTGCQWNLTLQSVQMTVAPDSDPALLYQHWRHAKSGYYAHKNPRIGPYPSAQLPSPPVVWPHAYNTPREIQAQSARILSSQDEHTRRVLHTIRGAPPLVLRDQLYWEEWSTACESDPWMVGFTNTWARLMQRELRRAHHLEDVWHSACLDAYRLFAVDESTVITAKQVLIICWHYGAQLKKCIR